MKTNKLIAFGLMTFFVAYGCAATPDESADDPGTADEEFVGFKGNVDQASIVEATTIMLTQTDNPLLDSNLDLYNREDPFAVRGNVYRDAFAANLIKFDKIDGKTDWTPELTKKWLTRMKSSYLVLDTSKPCDFANPHTYLEIERAMLTGTAHTTCGGRMPNEDALDVTMDFLARGPSAKLSDEGSFGDGLEQATQKSTDAFPYLADVNE